MLLKRQEFREKRDTDTEYENDLFDIRKSVSGAVLFIQKDHTVMLMNSGEVHKPDPGEREPHAAAWGVAG